MFQRRGIQGTASCVDNPRTYMPRTRFQRRTPEQQRFGNERLPSQQVFGIGKIERARGRIDELEATVPRIARPFC
jgi:hypothetical protein